MELHHKIIEVLKQEFPALVIPEIQEGFAISIGVSIERLSPDEQNPVKYYLLLCNRRFHLHSYAA